MIANAVLSARREFEEIAKEIGDIQPTWLQDIHSLPQYTMSNECEMMFAMSALSSRKASLKYDEFVSKIKSK